MTLRVGLTGNVAAGKSTVARIWEASGARLIDADELARRAVAPGSPGVAAVAQEFGGEVLTPEGGLDRSAMRALVFRDPDARRRLEAIVHPEVERLRLEEEARLSQEDGASTVVVHDIPLLFEVGLEERFDVVVLVDAPEDERLRRLVEERGLPEDEARGIIAAQQPAGPKRSRADVVIDNDGTLAELERKARAAWAQLLRRAGREPS